jgi:molybdate transport system substrate-binding protein
MRSRPLQTMAWVACVVALLAVPAHTQPAPRRLAIAAASDLQAVLPALVRGFERSAAATVTVSFGSSGSFFAQIQNGAPFDLFMSADIDYPTRLAAAGAADASSLYRYATGRIALWTRKESGLDMRKGLAVLTEARVKRVAIANPEHAPYGRAAVAALRQATLYDAVRPKLVLGENISQTAQLVDSGNADAGILAMSLVLGPALRASGTYAEIPASAHPPIEQAAIIVSASRSKALAQEFLAYFRRADTAALLRRFGLTPPAPPR